MNTQPIKRGIAIWHLQSPKSQGMTILGVMWVLVGIGVLMGSNVVPSDVFHTLIPSWIRAALWIATGLYAIYAAFTRKHKNVAIGCLQIMPVIRVASYLWSWLVWLWPGGPVGYADGWYQAAFQSALIFAVWAVASFPMKGAHDHE